MTTLPEANAKFAIKLFNRLKEEHPCDNILFSPVNATRALGVLAFASGCEQAAEIEKVLHWDEVRACDRPRSQRYLTPIRSFVHTATKSQQRIIDCPKSRPHLEPACPKARTCPEPACPKPKPRPEPMRPKPRPCPEQPRPEPSCHKPRRCPEQPRPEPSCHKPRRCPEQPRPEPSCHKPRPCPAETRPEPSCPKTRAHPEPPCSRPRPCPEPARSPCPERCVPEYECETPKGVHTAFSKILATLHAPSTNYALSFANKIYGDHAIAVFQKFIYCALKLYWTDIEGVDIQNAPEEVRRIINLWVEVQTHGKIRDLLPKDSFDCLAQLLHMNCVYFKGQWDVKFDKELTVEVPFYAHHAHARDFQSQRGCHTVLLMNRKGVYNIGTVDFCGVEVQVLEVPYKDHELSLFVLLPTDCSPEALQQLEDSLSYEHLLDWSCELKPTEVDVFLPKFSLERGIHAIEYLDLPNLQDPEKADFSQATPTEGVALTQLVHDTYIEIDEEGGEEPEPPRCTKDRRPCREAVKFVPDHPFLYFIRHNCTQSILVLGRFAQPE